MPSGLWEALKHREQLFVAAYLADPRLRAEAAAIAAGYSPTGAGSNGAKMLRKATVVAAVDAAVAARALRVVVDADRVLREVDTVSLSDITHYRLTDDGNVTLADGAPPDAMKSISSIRRKTRVETRGTLSTTSYDVEFKLWDKPGTLRLSMQHRGMLIERHEVKLPPGSGVLAVPVAPSAAQWGAMAAAQQDGLRGAKESAAP